MQMQIALSKNKLWTLSAKYRENTFCQKLELHEEFTANLDEKKALRAKEKKKQYENVSYVTVKMNRADKIPHIQYDGACV